RACAGARLEAAGSSEDPGVAQALVDTHAQVALELLRRLGVVGAGPDDDGRVVVQRRHGDVGVALAGNGLAEQVDHRAEVLVDWYVQRDLGNLLATDDRPVPDR